jgi:hypothetical protein
MYKDSLYMASTLGYFLIGSDTFVRICCDLGYSLKLRV